MDDNIQTLLQQINYLTHTLNNDQLDKALRSGGYKENEISGIIYQYDLICCMAKDLMIEDK